LNQHQRHYNPRKEGDLMKKVFVLCAVLTMSMLGLAVKAEAATWYVATNGSDSNTCTSTSSPCASINGAYQKASGGDIIQMAAGTYPDQTLQAKSPASTITVQPASGAQVTLGGLTINGAKRVEIRDLDTNDFKVDMNSQYVTLRNVDVKGWLGYLGGSDISMIGGSVGPMVDIHPQIAPANGWQGQGVNFLFDGVLFHDITRTSSTVHTECLQIAGTTNMIIRNSKFKNCSVNDVQITEYNGSGAPQNFVMENTWLDTPLDVGTNRGSTPAFNVNSNIASAGTFTLRFNSSTAYFALQPSSMSGTVTGNAVNGGIYDAGVGCKSNAVYTYNVTQGQSCGGTNRNASPSFVNAGAFDLRLASGSAAIDLVPSTVSAPAKDIMGTVRPQGTGFDAGAFEVTSSTAALAPPTGVQTVVR
jgi:hypothetical protein